MKKFVLFVLFYSTFSIAQYYEKDGNRIGISGGISQSTLNTSNFGSKPGNGFAGGLSVRGNYYNNWSMIYGMQFFINKFSLETTNNSFQLQDTEYALSGAQVRLLMSYNIIKNHISFDFGPVLQINGKLNIDNNDQTNKIIGTSLKANQIIDVSKINGNAYFGISAGTKVVRAVVSYQYGFTNVFNKLNSENDLILLNNNNKFNGKLGTICGQIIFNL